MATRQCPGMRIIVFRLNIEFLVKVASHSVLDHPPHPLDHLLVFRDRGIKRFTDNQRLDAVFPSFLFFEYSRLPQINLFFPSFKVLSLQDCLDPILLKLLFKLLVLFEFTYFVVVVQKFLHLFYFLLFFFAALAFRLVDELLAFDRVRVH